MKPLLALLLATTSSFALTPGEEAFLKLVGRDDATVIPLWPGDGAAPNETRTSGEEKVESPRENFPKIREVMVPSMIVVPPPAGVPPTKVTFLFAPGGAYNSLALPNAADLCKWAGAMGAHTVVLKYRVPRIKDDEGRRIPLSDAQRAIRLLRSKAGELKIVANKIIVVGSSAGGHLAFNLANNHGEKTYRAIDDADQQSARPNAAVLMYAAYLTKPITSLDADPHAHLDKVSPERTPPVFMAITRPDKFNWGNLKALMHLRAAKVPVEFHAYPEGGHGGCFDKYPFMEFVRPCARFLKDQGILTEEMQKAGDAWLDAHEKTFLKKSAPENVGAALKITGNLPTAKQTEGDKRLASYAKELLPILALWPGDATRADDPAKHLVEATPDRGDNILRIQNVAKPTLHLWRPKRPDGRCIIVFPGGGYGILAAQHEGTEIAAWLNEQGITAFLAKYRVPRRKGLEKHAVALQDAQRAIRLVRSRAAEFGIDPNQIGVLGFSAGGHLSTLTVHQAAKESYKPIDEIDRASARPDFAILIYPAYLTRERKGPELDPLVGALPSLNDYPPIFTTIAADDPFTPGALYYYLSLLQAKVPNELHVYARGGHGKGLREVGYPFSQWTGACERWLEDLKRGTTDINLKAPSKRQ